MLHINNPTSNYSVFHVRTTNIIAPWREIQEKAETPMNFIVINPIKGKNPYKNNKNSHMLYGEYKIDIDERCVNTDGSINTDDDDDDDSIYTYVVNANICCLKKSSSNSKFVPFSLFTALTSIFNSKFERFDINESDIKPCIVINTQCHYHDAPKSTITQMINEITAAFINQYKEYPTIFVAYDNTRKFITEVEVPSFRKTYKTEE